MKGQHIMFYVKFAVLNGIYTFKNNLEEGMKDKRELILIRRRKNVSVRSKTNTLVQFIQKIHFIENRVESFFEILYIPALYKVSLQTDKS